MLPQVPNYYKIIKQPMALNTVKQKLQLKHPEHYHSPGEFVADVRLVFSNCAKYNEVSGMCLYWRRLAKGQVSLERLRLGIT